MTRANTATRYGSVAKSLHWLTALLIVTLIPLGIIANNLPYDTSEQLAQKALLFSVHKTLGVLTFFVALARIVWALTQPKPQPLHPERRLESFAADTVHWLLYGSLLVVPLSGWVHHAATDGFAPIWWPFGQNLPFVPKSEALAATTAGLHIVFERVLVLSLLLHVAGALKHHFVDRDVTLKRMWFGNRQSTPSGGRHRVAAPLAAALGAWVLALGIGAGLGVYERHGGPALAAVALDEVNSEWQVEAGSLGIGVTQLGSRVDGQFADWTADISFDPDAAGPVLGRVEVTVAIGSLTLGSVSSQAMEADYFNAEAFPTADFSGEITASDTGYVATGPLTIRGASVPVALPFTLQIEGNVARMEGGLTVDRRDFGIGMNMTDEGSLMFAVDIAVALTARRGGD